MSTILLTWELGGGLGHLVNLLPLARELSQRGNRVFAPVKTGRSATVGYSIAKTSAEPHVVLQTSPKTTFMRCM
jgi:UDP:flavonoid glycosyltransferase YjiC (YdhE family)